MTREAYERLTPMIRPLLSAAALLLAATAAEAGPKAAIFPFELNDLSLDGELLGPRVDETHRLELATLELRKLAAQDAGYDVLDLDPISAQIKDAAPLYKCNGCETELAQRVGAQVAITGYVRKVSNLILQMFIDVRDVDSGRITKVYHVDIKGNTDETWLRGVRFMVVNGLAGKP
jgi:hypothetical protein